MNTQCMMEVRDRDRLLDPENGNPSVPCSRWTEWKRCTNEGHLIFQMKDGKNIRVCFRCARTMEQRKWVADGNYAVFKTPKMDGDARHGY